MPTGGGAPGGGPGGAHPQGQVAKQMHSSGGRRAYNSYARGESGSIGGTALKGTAVAGAGVMGAGALREALVKQAAPRASMQGFSGVARQLGERLAHPPVSAAEKKIFGQHH